MFPIPSGRRESVTVAAMLRGGQRIRGRVAGASQSEAALLRILGAGLVLLSVGCDSLRKKHENPVLMDAPTRVSNIDPAGVSRIADAREPDAVTTVSRWEDWEDDTAIFNSQVAATVNGAPILNGDVLDRYSSYLIGMRESMREKRVPPEEYRKVREMFVQRDLPGHIQRRLLVESMRTSLKPEQVKALNEHLDMLFEKEVEKLKREMKVSTRTELELELNKKGTTLQNVKDNFTTERMAMEYVAIKMDKPEHIDRQDLVDYYQSHLDDYAVPAKVEWQQIQVSFGDAASKAKARDKMKLALQELAGGAPFEAVARKYSDGPTARDGGVWEPMESGTLADTALEELLFEMPIGQLSSIHEGPSAWQLVRVKSRRDAGRTPFGDVQEEIRKKLELEQNRKRPEKLFKKLYAEAVIESKYDLPELK